MRVALATNVLVAAFTTRGLCADLVRTVLAEHELIFGARVRVELRRVLETKIGLPAERIDQIDALLSISSVTVASPPTTLALRDPDDELVLSESIAAGAELLVSGDLDLLDAAALASIPILSPRGFWEHLRSSEPR